MSDALVIKKEIETEVFPLIQKARALTVASQNDYDIAMQVGKECANRIRFVEEGRLAKIKADQYAVYKQTMDLINEVVKPLKEVMALVKNKAIAWQQAENAKRAREAEEARRKAQAEADRKRKEEEDARLALAAEFEAAGEKEAADAMISEPVHVDPVHVAEPEKVKQAVGTTLAQNWTWEVVDFNLLPNAYKLANEKALTQLAKHDKDKAVLPGVRFYDAGSVRFGR